MKRRKAAAGQRKKAVRRTAKTKARPRRPAGAGKGVVAKLERELAEALEQQTATSKVLEIISSSPGDLKPVFAAMLENAVRICDATFGNIYRWNGGVGEFAAGYNTPPALAAARRRAPLSERTTGIVGRMRESRTTVHIADLAADPYYRDRSNAPTVAAVELGGARTIMSVPMLKDAELIGSFTLYRQEVRPFTDRQIALVTSFARQAVIAIENARLLTELRESLEQQTATADILGAIAASPNDADGSLRKIAETTARLFGAAGVSFRIADGDDFKLSVGVGQGAELITRKLYDNPAKRPKVSGRHLPGAVVRANRQIHIANTDQADPDKADWPGIPLAREAGIRTMIGTPLRIKGNAIGALMVYRNALRPFEPTEMQLLQTFADQAVIAIENARLFEAEQQRTHELTESLEQQTATANVLEVISRSAFDLQAVFETVVETSARLCGADRAGIHRLDGDVLRAVFFNAPKAEREWLEQNPIRLGPDSGAARAARERRTINNPDVVANPEHTLLDKFKGLSGTNSTLRSVLWVPILKADEVLGVLTLWNSQVRPFTDKQIALVEIFADQAAIAIENVRLFEAERQRTRELTESLEQQTATSEVLKIISSSPGDLEPVFRAMLENAVRICGAHFGNIYRFADDTLRLAASYNVPPAFAEARRQTPHRHGSQTVSGRMLATKSVVHLADAREQVAYTVERDPGVVAAVELGGVRTLLAVPLLKEDELVGSITLYRQEVNPFVEKQIALVTNFARQAVIAIENARLLSELRESLEQQTATAEVLSVINASRGDLQPVFEAMVEKARRLCEADAGHLALPVGDDYRSAAVSAMSPEMTAMIRSISYAPGRGTAIGRALAERRPIQISDIGADKEHVGRQAARKGFIRTILGVPLLREGEAIGAFGLSRQRVEPFSDRQINLVRTFADQAVIAIENTRLFNELRQRTADLTESLEHQTATSEVLQVISSSPGDLKPVFEAVLANAAHLCRAEFGILLLSEGDAFRVAGVHNVPQMFVERWQREPIFRPSPLAPVARAVASRDVVHVVNAKEDPAYLQGDPPIISLVDAGGARTILGVPMIKDAEVIGALTIFRQELRPFSDKQIDLVKSFAAQAVIAIENTRLLTELRQSLEQQTATSEVLSVISSSPGDLLPVFQSMLENAVRLCGATFGNIYRYDRDLFHLVAAHNTPPALAEARREAPQRPADNMMFSRLMAKRESVQVPDVSLLPNYIDRSDAAAVSAVELGGVRTVLVVPMLKEDDLIGAFSLFRDEVLPFNDKQVALVTGFAAQAVIAIENARLLSELRQRTDDLTESLEQQTATSEVLRSIAGSRGDLEQVFNIILESANRLCEANYSTLYLREAGGFRAAARHGHLPETVDKLWWRGDVFQPSPGVPMSRAVATRRPVMVTDLADERSYREGYEWIVAGVDQAGIRSMCTMPMLKDDEVIGVASFYRREIRPFNDKQIALVQNFANQAVIAIENTRLLNELRESLAQQTATSEVLRIISSSPGELRPVFETILANAVDICDANNATFWLYRDGGFRATAHHHDPGIILDLENPGPKTGLGRMRDTKQIVQIADYTAEPAFHERDPFVVRAVETFGVRTSLSVPLLKEGELIGAISILRTEVRPFSDKQIELIAAFADQAVIAIENARLLNELRARTAELSRSVGELRALGEVSQAVSSTLDLETVLETIVAKAVQLSATDAGAIYVFDDAARDFHLRATYGMDAALIAALSDTRITANDRNIVTLLAEREPVQSADLSRGETTDVDRIILRAGYRSRLTAPLIRGDDIVGMLVVRRRAPGSFAENTVDLIKTFAAQSAVAIQNARLYANVETRTRELAASLADLRTAQDRLVQTEKLASLGQLTAGIAHEIKNPLNFVNNFSSLSAELIDELQQIINDIEVGDEKRAEVAELTGMLRGNLEKVVQHGKRADSIVKNMLLHSRQGSGEHQLVDVNALVEESLNLAYHGARAEKQGFNITLERSFDPDAGTADLFPQEITRVLLNLIANGFYAATKRKGETNGGNYEPTLSAATRSLGDSVEIRIRDNGTGIPPEVKEKMFNPFFTTKPAGEGTGLGLSLSYDIVVKQHSGSMEVDTAPGEFTEFRIVLPRGSVGTGKTGGTT